MKHPARFSVAVFMSLLLAWSARAASPGAPQRFEIRDYGTSATCAGAPDDTAAIAAAIGAADASGAGVVEFPAGHCKISGTLVIASSNIVLEGQGIGLSFIECAGAGTEDCITIRGRDRPIYDTVIRGFHIMAAARTGGSCFALDGAANTLLSRITLGPCFSGITANWTNNTTIEHFVLQWKGARGAWGIKFMSPAENSRRSDVFTLSDGVVNMLYGGADCFDWDGMAQTVRVFGVGLLECRIGMHVLNTARSRIYFPEFLFATDLELDGESLSSVVIDGGTDFHLDNSDISNTSGAAGQGDADGDCFVVNPDLEASITRNVFVSNSRIGNCRGRALYADARDIHLTGNNFHSASKAGKNRHPQVEFGPDTVDFELIGGKVSYEFGDPLDASYGVVVDKGAQNGVLGAANYSGNNLGGIDDLAAPGQVTALPSVGEHAAAAGPAPSLGSGTSDCGASPTIVGNDALGRITVGAPPSGGKCTITFARPYAHPPVCVIADETRAVLVRPTAATEHSIAFAGTFEANDSLAYQCAGYQ